jgi:hypothetical protein
VAGFTSWGLVQVRRRFAAGRLGADGLLVPFRSLTVPRATAAMAVIDVLRSAGIDGPDVRPDSIVAWRGATARREGASIEEVAALLGIKSLDRTLDLIGAGGEAEPG